MRKIRYHLSDHNTARAVLVAGLLLLLLGLTTGCRDEGRQEAPDAARAACPLKINDEPWQEFKSLAGAMSAGQDVPVADLEVYAMLPSVQAWSRSLAPNEPTPINLVNWLQNAWSAEVGRKSGRKVNVNRTIMIRNYRYDQTHTAVIDSLLEFYRNGDATCELSDLIEKWISPDHRPAELVIVFLPAIAEVRLDEGQIFADVGVLAAGGLDRTSRTIASLLYRKFEAMPGENPLEVEGDQAVAECLRVMHNEGIATWIEQTSTIAFDQDHPKLFKVQIVPVDFYRKAVQTIERFEENLPALLGDPDIMAAQGQQFARNMAGGNSFTSMGLAAAELICARLGEERLLAVRNSVPGFWAAYQEAALQNPTPLPRPGQAGAEYYEALPALSDDLYTGLQQLLEGQFK